MYSNRMRVIFSPKHAIITCCSVVLPEKITSKASDVAEKHAIITYCSVLPPEIVMHDPYIGIQRITLNASCMTISGGRNKQLVCSVTGFTSDFLSFIVVEHI